MAYLYCITDGELYKIGWAKNVHKRLRVLQCGSSRELKILHKVLCTGNAQAVMRERQVHKSASKHRVRGEWFTEKVLNNKYWKRYLLIQR